MQQLNQQITTNEFQSKDIGYIIKEAKKYYQHIDEQLLKITLNALSDIGMPKADAEMVTYIISGACEKHFKYGLNMVLEKR